LTEFSAHRWAAGRKNKTRGIMTSGRAAGRECRAASVRRSEILRLQFGPPAQLRLTAGGAPVNPVFT
jgi:hypothetical protein